MGHQEDILIYPENYITIKLKLLVLQSEVKMRVFCGHKVVVYKLDGQNEGLLWFDISQLPMYSVSITITSRYR